MSFSNLSQILITREVYDFMFIQIDDATFHREAVQYAILDNSGQLIKKGMFRGSIVQLRLSNLEEGIYHLSLGSKRKSSATHEFVKRTPADGQQTLFSF